MDFRLESLFSYASRSLLFKPELKEGLLLFRNLLTSLRMNSILKTV